MASCNPGWRDCDRRNPRRSMAGAAVGLLERRAGMVKDAATLPVAGAGARCATELSRAHAAAMLAGELRRWLAEEPPADLDGLTLARLVTREVRWVGTHHLDPGVLAD